MSDRQRAARARRGKADVRFIASINRNIRLAIAGASGRCPYCSSARIVRTPGRDGEWQCQNSRCRQSYKVTEREQPSA